MKRVLAVLLTVLLITMAGSCAKPAATQSSAVSEAQSQSQSQSQAEGWTPQKDVVCIIPFAPGGGSDVLTRTMMEYLKLPTGINMVTTYVEGGAGALGAQQCGTSPADGYTILAHNPSNMVSQGVSEINNLWKELTLLGMVVDDWTVVGTNKQTGWKNIDDMIAYAKEHPGEIKYGLTGTGNGMAVTQKVCDMLGIECTIVPYDGGAESRAALLGNHIQLENTQSSDARNYVASGDIIPLYVIASTRCPLFPDTPTLQELGYDLVLGAPRGYYAPPELDPQITAYYENMLEEVCKNEAFVKACADLGYVVNFVGSADGMKWQEEYYKTQISLTK